MQCLQGTLVLPEETYVANGSPGGGSGGHLEFSALNLTTTGSGNLFLQANGVGGGNGGTTILQVLNPSFNLVTGSGVGQLRMSATGGSAGSVTGDGGVVTVQVGGNLTVNPSHLLADPLGESGRGAWFSLGAGVGGQGILLVSGNINASGKGAGSGGRISLRHLCSH